jgi:hypothetical protein
MYTYKTRGGRWGVMLRKGDPKSIISAPMGPGGGPGGVRGGVPSARFFCDSGTPGCTPAKTYARTQWGRAPLPMVCERRGVHATVIGNPRLHPQGTWSTWSAVSSVFHRVCVLRRSTTAQARDVDGDPHTPHTFAGPPSVCTNENRDGRHVLRRSHTPPGGAAD